MCVWHRRAGKDSATLNWTAIAAHQRTGTYWHMLPEANQARKVVWDGIDRAGRRMIDQVFPPELRTNTISHEMKVELACGSIWQCVGSDNYNSLIGSNPVGVVFSEFAVAKPAAWDYIRPILAENGGWAVFITTPRGHNHAYDLWRTAQEAGWFTQLLTIRDTQAISEEVVEEERKAGMSEDMIRQEFYCSWEASSHGAYYAQEMRDADEQQRIGNVPHDPGALVHVAFDLGIDDATALWFAQMVGKEVRLIDYYESSGVGLDHYVRVMQERRYNYGQVLVPHDASVRELGTGKSRLEMLASLGVKAEVVKKFSLEDGINAARMLLPRCWFDAKKTVFGIDCLRQYRRAWNEERRVFEPRPYHDYTSHAADAFRYLAIGLRPERKMAPLNYSNAGIV